MNKRGIWVIVVIAAFIAGMSSTTPFVEAAEGWKAAVDDLQMQINDILSQEPEISVTVRTVSNPGGLAGQTEVSCNEDEVLTGGGYTSIPWRPTLSENQNGPSPDGKKWIVELQLGPPIFPGNTVPDYDVYALCAKLVS